MKAEPAPSTWAIGDVHGWKTVLDSLLDRLAGLGMEAAGVRLLGRDSGWSGPDTEEEGERERPGQFTSLRPPEARYH